MNYYFDESTLETDIYTSMPGTEGTGTLNLYAVESDGNIISRIGYQSINNDYYGYQLNDEGTSNVGIDRYYKDSRFDNVMVTLHDSELDASEVRPNLPRDSVQIIKEGEIII